MKQNVAQKGLMIYRLDNPRAWRTYTGGKLIESLHGAPEPENSNYPEEWIMSVVTANNGERTVPGEGLSHLPELGNLSLKEMLESNGEELLGRDHYRKYGANPGVLIKLIDSHERLTTQVHPNRKKSMSLFNSPYGKTECWHILGGENPNMFFGFKEGITEEYFRKLFREQDIPGMLECMHHLSVRPGDTILIPGGLPHAIGADTFLIEIQEPTDYTIRVERTTPGGLKVEDVMCHQGLGFDRMFECFDFEGLPEEKLRERVFLKPEKLRKDENGTVTGIVDYDDTDCFAMNRIEVMPSRSLEIQKLGTFAALYVLQGEGIIAEKDSTLAAGTGDQFFIGADCDDITIANNGDRTLTAFLCFGPSPER